MPLIQSTLMAVFVALVLYGAWTDAKSLRIPNWVSLALLGAFVPMAWVSGLGLEALVWHVGAGALLLVVGFALFGFGLFGGGDAKLLAVTALWVGWDELLLLVFAVVLVGGVLSLAVILLRKGLGLWPDWLVKSAEGLFTPNKAVPYGIAIAIGTMMVVPNMDVLPASWATLLQPYMVEILTR